jgi:hypothetical protein
LVELENHHHCPYCGDMTSPEAKTCKKIVCIQRYEKRNVKCVNPGTGYVFRPKECVVACRGNKVIHDLQGYREVCRQVHAVSP